VYGSPAGWHSGFGDIPRAVELLGLVSLFRLIDHVCLLLQRQRRGHPNRPAGFRFARRAQRRRISSDRGRQFLRPTRRLQAAAGHNAGPAVDHLRGTTRSPGSGTRGGAQRPDRARDAVLDEPHVALLVRLAAAHGDEHGVAVGRIDDVGPAQGHAPRCAAIPAMNSSPAITASAPPRPADRSGTPSLASGAGCSRSRWTDGGGFRAATTSTDDGFGEILWGDIFAWAHGYVYANSSSACEPRRTNSRVSSSGFW